jgi:hypothetical protein
VVGSGPPGVEAPAVESVTAVDDATTTTVDASGIELVVRRVLGGPDVDGDVETLIGTWAGSGEPAPLAYARRRPN